MLGKKIDLILVFTAEYKNLQLPGFFVVLVGFFCFVCLFFSFSSGDLLALLSPPLALKC